VKHGYMVFWSDNNGCECPMTADPECEGALHAGSGDPIVFASRGDARKAIQISTYYNRMLMLQGKVWNEDFTMFGGGCVRIRRVVFEAGGAK
jgi:hypothetical protein